MQIDYAIVSKWLYPANVVLFLSIVLFCSMLWKANKRPDFSIVDSLRDDAGKASLARIMYAGAFIASTWVLMLYSTDKVQDPHEFFNIYTVYCLVWAAPKVLERWIVSKYGREDKR